MCATTAKSQRKNNRKDIEEQQKNRNIVWNSMFFSLFFFAERLACSRFNFRFARFLRFVFVCADFAHIFLKLNRGVFGVHFRYPSDRFFFENWLTFKINRINAPATLDRNQFDLSAGCNSVDDWCEPILFFTWQNLRDFFFFLLSSFGVGEVFGCNFSHLFPPLKIYVIKACAVKYEWNKLVEKWMNQ